MSTIFSNEGKQNLDIELEPASMPTENKAGRIVIAIDYGTTFSGVSWASSSESLQNVEIVSSWGQELKPTSMVRQGTQLTLIDTPGFDDRESSNERVLQTVAEYLQELYRTQTWINGIIYLHRIPDDRTTRSNLRNLSMFQRLCGYERPSSMLAVTYWKTMKLENNIHLSREHLRSEMNTRHLLCDNSTQTIDVLPELSWDVQGVSWFVQQAAALAQALYRMHESCVEEDKQNRNRDALYGRHGEIEPENILWPGDREMGGNSGGVLQIADFGLGRFHCAEDRSRNGKSLHCKNEFMESYDPPQDLNRHIPRKDDIWSLGCVFSEVMIWLSCGQDALDDTRAGDATFYRRKRSNDLLHTRQLNTIEENDRRRNYLGTLFANLMLYRIKEKLSYDSRNSGHHLKDRHFNEARETEADASSPGFRHHVGQVIRSIMSNFTGKARATTKLSRIAPSLLLLATPASASPTFDEDCESSLRSQIANFFHKYTPFQQEPMEPKTLLSYVFLETLIIVALCTHNRADTEQMSFLCAGILVSCVTGAVYARTAQDFVLQHLFLGCLAGLVGSAIWHALQRRRERGVKMTEKGICFETAEIGDGILRDEKM